MFTMQLLKTNAAHDKLEFQSRLGLLRLVGSSLNSIRSECILRSVLRISRHTADSVKTHDLLRIESARRFSIQSRISLRFADSNTKVEKDIFLTFLTKPFLALVPLFLRFCQNLKTGVVVYAFAL